jgi:uncharacterized protein
LTAKLFANLPVKDLDKTIKFFTHLGFTFNPQFTDENATCMNIGNDSFVMLLVEKFFKKFINKEICDTTKYTEVILALSANNREQVDNMITKAIEAGGKEYMKSQDYGWMYHRSFEDINGHIWELVYMDESLIPK